MNSSGSANLSSTGGANLSSTGGVSLSSIRDVPNERFIFRSPLKKQYYHLPSKDWNKPYNKELRNALFNEPLIYPENRPLSFSDFQPETYQAMWARHYSRVDITPAVTTQKIINFYLKRSHSLSLPDDYYSNCLSSKGPFMSFLNANTLCTYRRHKVVMEYAPLTPAEGRITALQVDAEGTNYFGTRRGTCYSLTQGSQKYHFRPILTAPSKKEQICSMALSNNLLYTSSKGGDLTITCLRENSQRLIPFSSSNFVCRVLPPFKSNHYLALGHNSNEVSIFDERNLTKPACKYNLHNAAVRALAWNPKNKNEIASGGGSNDREIHIWDVMSGKRKDGIATNAQICNLFWNEWEGEQYLTSINSSGIHENSAMFMSYPSISIYKWENNLLDFKTDFEIMNDNRPIHSAIDEDDSHNLMVAGKNYFYMLRLFDKEPTELNGLRYPKKLTEKYTIR